MTEVHGTGRRAHQPTNQGRDAGRTRAGEDGCAPPSGDRSEVAGPDAGGPQLPDALARRSLQRMRADAWDRGVAPLAAPRAPRREGPTPTAGGTRAAGARGGAGVSGGARQAAGQATTATAGVAPWDQARLRRRALGEEGETGPGLPGGKGRARASRWDPRTSKRDLDVFVTRMGWSTRLQVASVVARWPELVGPQVAEHCRVETFDTGRLVLRASSSAWAQQIRLLMPGIEAMLAREVGADVVTEVRVLGPTSPSWTHGRRTARGGRGPRDTYG